MHRPALTCALLAAASTLTWAQDLQLTTLPTSFASQFGAACLDGSPPALWHYPGDPAKWIVFIEGGGWCFDPAGPNATIVACAGRATGSGGSSKGLATSFNAGGLLSPNATINPHYHNWSMVFIHYCDGSSHSSAVEGPVAVPKDASRSAELEGGDVDVPSQIYFRGRANLRAVVAYLSQSLGMAAATDVILSGGSAGATSVYLALDEVVTWLPSSVRLVGAPDAGFFVDAVDAKHNTTVYRDSFIAADPAWNASAAGTLNADCLTAFPSGSGEAWRCFLQQYAAPFIRTPLFISQSALDMWQVLNDLDLGCVPSTDGAPVAGIPSCDAAQLAVMSAYRKQQLAALAPTLAGYPGTGAWVDTCFVHEQNVDYCSTQSLPNCIGFSAYTVDTGASGNVTLSDAFHAWHAATVEHWDAVTTARGAHREQLRVAGWAAPALPSAGGVPATRIDLARAGDDDGGAVPQVQIIDQVEWPHNPSCPFPTPKARA